MVKVRNQKLQFRHFEFAIYKLIDDCPDRTVVRELLKNAEENAVLLTPPGRIEWFVEEMYGAKKLGLFNEGPGMSAHDLDHLMDMASTGKRLGTEHNFGQGGKVSGLKASPAGLIYRSCKDGRVCQITLAAEHTAGAEHPTYVKMRFPVEVEGRIINEPVQDVTDAFRNRKDRPLSKDWTEVLLIGRTPDQNSVADLLQNATRKNWLIREINQRFYRFAPGVVVRNADATSGQKQSRNAEGLEALTLRYSEGGDGRHEDVQAVHPTYGPVTIRYCKLRGNWGTDDATANSRAKTMEAYGVGTRGDHVCLVWKAECYEFRSSWSKVSGPFGVTFGSANVAIQVLLADDAPVKNNTYRDRLLRKDESGHYVVVDEFADLACQNRPRWLVEYVEEQARKNNSNGNVMERLRQFLQEMMLVGEPRPRVDGQGADTGDIAGGSGNGSGGGGGGGGGGSRPAVGTRTTQHFSGIPRVEFTRDPAKLGDMHGRAALYERSANLVLLNPEHFRYQQDLQNLFDHVGPDADRRAIAQSLFDEEYQVQAGKYVVQAWLFRGRSDWDDAEFEQALGMGAMTVHLASPTTLHEARRKYRTRVAATKEEAARAGAASAN